MNVASTHRMQGQLDFVRTVADARLFLLCEAILKPSLSASTAPDPRVVTYTENPFFERAARAPILLVNSCALRALAVQHRLLTPFFFFFFFFIIIIIIIFFF